MRLLDKIHQCLHSTILILKLALLPGKTLLEGETVIGGEFQYIKRDIWDVCLYIVYFIIIYGIIIG